MAKKLLSEILHERMDSVTYSKIRALMIQLAQSGKYNLLVLPANIDDYAITRFQNEGIKVERVNGFGYDKIKLSWPRN